MNELKKLHCKHIESAIISEIQGVLYTLKTVKRALLDGEISFVEAKRKGAKNMAKLAMHFERLDKANFYFRENRIEISVINFEKDYLEVVAFFGNV